jgi:hypothetical protein
MNIIFISIVIDRKNWSQLFYFKRPPRRFGVDGYAKDVTHFIASDAFSIRLPLSTTGSLFARKPVPQSQLDHLSDTTDFAGLRSH